MATVEVSRDAESAPEVFGDLGECPKCGSREVKDASYWCDGVWVRCQRCGTDRIERD
jgi:ribosomal protein L37AE/L43A